MPFEYTKTCCNTSTNPTLRTHQLPGMSKRTCPCGTTGDDSLFAYTTGKVQQRHWADVISGTGSKPLRRICKLHFNENDFIRTSTGVKLKNSATPSRDRQLTLNRFKSLRSRVDDDIEEGRPTKFRKEKASGIRQTHQCACHCGKHCIYVLDDTGFVSPPKDPTECKQWCDVIMPNATTKQVEAFIANPSQHPVCKLHFDEDQFGRNGQRKKGERPRYKIPRQPSKICRQWAESTVRGPKGGIVDGVSMLVTPSPPPQQRYLHENHA